MIDKQVVAGKALALLGDRDGPSQCAKDEGVVVREQDSAPPWAGSHRAYSPYREEPKDDRSQTQSLEIKERLRQLLMPQSV